MKGDAGYNLLFRKKVTILVSVVFISTLFSACALGKNESKIPTLVEPVKYQYTLYEVKRGNIENVLETNGVFVPKQEKNLCFKCKDGVLKKLDVQAGDYVKKGQLLAELDTDDLNNQLQQEEIKMKQIQLQYEKMVNSKASDIDLKQASLDIDQEKFVLANIQEEIENSKLISTLDGRVVKCTEKKQCDEITEFDTVVTIVEDSNINIECFESNINKFKLNMNVNFSYGNKEYTGTVTQLNIPDASKSQNDETPTGSMTVSMDKTPDNAHLGEFVRVYSTLAKKENVLIIPIKLVKAWGSDNMVEVIENGKKIEKSVQLGVENDKDVEVTSGLKEGEKLVQ